MPTSTARPRPSSRGDRVRRRARRAHGRRRAAAGQRRAPPSPRPRAAVRRDGLLEPERRHRQGRQGPRHLHAPRRPCREYRFTARGVTGADTLVGQATAELAVRKDFFVDLKAPGHPDPGGQAPVHRPGPPRGRRRHGRAAADGLRRGPRAGLSPKTIEVKGDGVEEVLFEPVRGPRRRRRPPDPDGPRRARRRDELTVEVPIRPWGVQAFASASGTASDDATVFVGLPPGRAYESPEMLVVALADPAADARRAGPGRRRLSARARASRTCILPPPPDTTADRAGDLLAATSALAYLRTAGGADAPEAARLTDRIRGLVAELVAAPERRRRLALGRRPATAEAPRRATA